MQDEKTPESNKTVVLSIRVTEKEREAIKKMAALESQFNLSEYVRKKLFGVTSD